MTMTPDQHLWACAIEIERQHGGHAADVAAKRVIDLEEEGDQLGSDTWRAILERIEALQGEGTQH